MTIVIKGGRVIDATGERTADVVIDDAGRIAAVGADLSADRTLDAGGCVVAPGLVDLHAHLRQPGQEEAETIETGARAAALGGYTCILAMPNTVPAVDHAGIVREVLELGRTAPCDVHTSGAITVGRAGEQLAPLGEMADLGVRLFTDDGAGVQTPGSCAGPWSTPAACRPAASASCWPSTARTPCSPRAATCTRGSGRSASASPGSPPRPRS